jgi:hypothetical protein
MKSLVTVKVSQATRGAIKEISKRTGLKMWAALEQAVMAKLKDVREQPPTIRQ